MGVTRGPKSKPPTAPKPTTSNVGGSGGGDITPSSPPLTAHTGTKASAAGAGVPSLPSLPGPATGAPPTASGGENAGTATATARTPLALKIGVAHRTAMGEYIPDKDGPLSALALPTPSAQSYSPHLPPTGRCISILGKHTAPASTPGMLGPGPQKYNAGDPRAARIVLPESPAWSFAGTVPATRSLVAAAARTDFEDDLGGTPGPAVYDPRQGRIGTEGPSFSISGRFETAASAEPGPDHYFPPPSATGVCTAPSYSFGTKSSTIVDPTPGPQSYSTPRVPPHASTAPLHTFGPRIGYPVFTDIENVSHPAPSAYFPKLTWNEKAATLKGWYTESKALKTPGPANYIMPAALFSGPQFSIIGKHDPEETLANEKLSRPGPASYSPDVAATRARGPAYTLKSRTGPTRPPKHHPGPGAYTPRDRQLRGNDSSKVTIKGRWRSWQECTPGPADYTPAPSLTPAQLARLDARENERRRAHVHVAPPMHAPTPGPGSYSPRLCTPSSPGFTLGKRLDSSTKTPLTKTPSPNAYPPGPPAAPPAAQRGPKAGATLKSRMSPYVTVFPTTRVDTLRVLV
ncbi:hypothetical protein HDU87_002280 [Geranomyces variabilis]|uniref:Uncharacterized protein n=1 Tax=Geranomyces variabilis TaxID=109894 RepID=A0AAD5TLM2_9FUNG|nr:hypothetical protein HDU87_002280 [Geranomyces variabilis]